MPSGRKRNEEIHEGAAMSSKAMSLKRRINNYAKKNNVAAQVVLQNYMIERFLERLSVSEYKQKFVIKGGILISAIVGLDIRSTMDLDTTLRDFPLTEDKVKEAVMRICEIKLTDEVIFNLVSISSIRKDDLYGGFCIRLDFRLLRQSKINVSNESIFLQGVTE